MHSGSRVVVFSSVLVLALSTLIVAQTATTSLRGTVTDPKGAIMQGAIVTLSNTQTGYSRATKSGNDGVYQFLEVPPATYQLTVSAQGFATVKQDRVTLQVSQPATLDIAMQVRGTTEIVEVSGEAPVVNTTDATQGNVFNTTQLLSLPSEGRDPVAILSLQPGVTYIGQNVDQGGDSRGGSVAGARSDQTNVTLDGLDNNDQLLGNAFQGALRAPLESIQEFRVTTSNSNADAGRSSGAQVSMVTKSGTNGFHGSLYEYNRSNIGQANDWFNEQAEDIAGLPNKPGPLVRNTFGVSLGGPIMKDRLFFFTNYEGQRTNEAIQTTRIVPSDAMRAGVMQYPCDPSDSACTPGFVDPGGNYSISADGIVAMTPQGLTNLDSIDGGFGTCIDNGTCPWGGGADPTALAIFQKYPSPNTDTLGDGLDYRGFTFAAPAPAKLDTYILKLDYKLTTNGNHSLFVKGHLQNFRTTTAPQFPTQPANDVLTDNSKGIFVGYTALFRPTLINNLRYGFIRQGLGDRGLSSSDHNVFRGLDDVQGFSNSVLTNVPVHNLVDDISWTKGKHTMQFGGNLRIIINNRTGNAQNISTADTNVFWLGPAGIANQGTGLDPAAGGYPAVDDSFGESYDFATAAIAGLLTETNKTYNQDKTGHFFAPGELITRNFKSTEGEFYVQDSWRVTPNLVLTGGLRYSLLQPPYEMHGNQVAPNPGLDSWFKQRGQDMLQGNTLNSQIPGGLVTMSLSGQANGKQPYWGWDYKDFAPRFAFAYSPHASTGFLHTLFGNAGKSSIRGGYGLYYDHFGEGIVNSFDKNGSFGLTTQLVNPAGSQDVGCTPRMTDLLTLPPANTDFCGQQVVGPPPPALPGVITPPTLFDPGSFAIYWGLDNKLKTPYSHVFDFSITRDLGHNFVFEASYVGRMGHRLLQEEDLAMPLDLVDPGSKMDYFTAATMLTKAANAGTDISQMAPIPFWEHFFPGAQGQLGFGPPGGTAQHNNSGCAPGVNFNSNSYTPTQAMYDMYSCFAGNETTALFVADLDCLPACATVNGNTSPFQFFDDQFSSLYSWRSIGNSAYNSMQLTLRRAVSSTLQFDFNYTFSKSIDIGSNAERINEFEGFGFASQVINSWSPGQLRALSDFDTKHQINSNWVYQLPFGRGRPFAGNAGRIVDAVIGGWGLSGIFHWTSGLPFSMGSGSGWPTNWQLQGEAVQTGPTGKIGVFRDSSGNPNMFQNTTQASGAFRFPYPGESGQRNELRGPGFFEIDAGLSKEWKIAEEKTVKFAWEAFNITNSVRFDAAQSANQFALTFGNFGAYSNTLSKPRVMQFSLRVGF